MRICIFTSDIDKTASEGITSLDDIDPSIHAHISEIYVTGYGWPTLELNSRRVYPLDRRNALKTNISCKLLSIIDNNKWIPTSLALIPIFSIQREIFETLLSFTPDVLIIHNLRWKKEFSFFIKRKMPDLPCCFKHDRVELPSEDHWKKYDPSVKVSIVLPTYNGAKYIRKSIDSCLEQTHGNLELIIVDDASTDETPHIINSYSDKRIKYVRHPRNLKLPRALNTGFKHATGDYLTWTSDDNFYTSDAIEVMVKFLLTYPETGYVYTDEYHIDENDNIDKYFAVGAVESLQSDNLIGGCFLYHRRVYEEIGEYDPDTYLAEDYDYWIRISKRFRMQRLRRPLYYYRLHKDSLTVKYGKYGTKLAGKVGDTVKKSHKIG